MSLALHLSPADLADRAHATKSVLAFLREAEMAGASVELTADAPFLTPEQVAKQLGVSRPTISRRIKAGDLAKARTRQPCTAHRVETGESLPLLAPTHEDGLRRLSTPRQHDALRG